MFGISHIQKPQLIALSQCWYSAAVSIRDLDANTLGLASCMSTVPRPLIVYLKSLISK